MRIVVLGAGALGAYFGARWQEAGADVTFLVREKRWEQIRSYGIMVESTAGNFHLEQPNVVTDVNAIEAVDLVFVSVKGYHLPGTLNSLKELTKKGAYVLPVLNGMEHISMLQHELGKSHVLGGLALIMATLNEHGHVIHSSDFHTLTFGPLDQTQTAICKQIEEITEKANMDGNYSDAISWELWKKYMFINAFSGITTATDLPIGPVREHRDTFRIAETILQEMKQLANAYHVEVSEEDVAQARQQLSYLADEATSSMHQDLRKGLPLEVDHLHGGAVRLAKAKGLDIPYTETVHGLIKPFENL